MAESTSIYWEQSESKKNRERLLKGGEWGFFVTFIFIVGFLLRVVQQLVRTLFVLLVKIIFVLIQTGKGLTWVTRKSLIVSGSWGCMHVSFLLLPIVCFPLLVSNKFFPALCVDCMFSHPCYRLHVFPLLEPRTCFLAPYWWCLHVFYSWVIHQLHSLTALLS